MKGINNSTNDTGRALETINNNISLILAEQEGDKSSLSTA